MHTHVPTLVSSARRTCLPWHQLALARAWVPCATRLLPVGPTWPGSGDCPPHSLPTVADGRRHRCGAENNALPRLAQ